jgi:hypothetical protein
MLGLRMHIWDIIIISNSSSSGRRRRSSSSSSSSTGKGKAVPIQAWAGPEGSRRLRLADFMTIGT